MGKEWQCTCDKQVVCRRGPHSVGCPMAALYQKRGPKKRLENGVFAPKSAPEVGRESETVTTAECIADPIYVTEDW